MIVLQTLTAFVAVTFAAIAAHHDRFGIACALAVLSNLASLDVLTRLRDEDRAASGRQHTPDTETPDADTNLTEHRSIEANDTHNGPTHHNDKETPAP